MNPFTTVAQQMRSIPDNVHYETDLEYVLHRLNLARAHSRLSVMLRPNIHQRVLQELSVDYTVSREYIEVADPYEVIEIIRATLKAN